MFTIGILLWVVNRPMEALCYPGIGLVFVLSNVNYCLWMWTWCWPWAVTHGSGIETHRISFTERESAVWMTARVRLELRNIKINESIHTFCVTAGGPITVGTDAWHKQPRMGDKINTRMNKRSQRYSFIDFHITHGCSTLAWLWIWLRVCIVF